MTQRRLTSERYFKPKDLNVRPKVMQSLAFKKMLEQKTMLIEGKEVPPTSSQLFREHLDALVPLS